MGEPFPADRLAAADSSTSQHPQAGTEALLGELEGLEGEVKPSRAKKYTWITASVVVLLSGLYVGAQWMLADKVPAGTTVAGVDLGGLTTGEAAATLQEQLAVRTREPIHLTAGTARATLDPATAGLTLDAEATAAGLTGFSLRPSRLWQHLNGGDETAPVIRIDSAALNSALHRLMNQLATAPVNGTVAFIDGQPIATAAKDGTEVEVGAAREYLTANWLLTHGALDLPTRALSPVIDQAATDAAFAQAELIMSGPVNVEVSGQTATLSPDLLASVARFQVQGAGLEPVFAAAPLVEEVLARTTNLLSDPVDARFEFRNNVPVIVDGAQGSELDPTELSAAVAAAAVIEAEGSRVVEVELTPVDPEVTRESLEALGVNEVIVEFSTPLIVEPNRTQNLRRGAELVTGTLVRPGEIFSLLETLRPIDAENGFRYAGVIVGGLHTDGMGGGLSQMATTTFNAGFLAGFEDIEHRPHSVYFERYPAGREATLSDPDLDMRFRNNTPFGALLQSWVTNGRLYVAIWSSPHFHVETSASERRNIVPTTPQRLSTPGCVPYGGGERGFTIDNTRRVIAPNGEIVIDETLTWTYRPDNPVICEPPPPPAPTAG